jgi:hypothetical protein
MQSCKRGGILITNRKIVFFTIRAKQWCGFPPVRIKGSNISNFFEVGTQAAGPWRVLQVRGHISAWIFTLLANSICGRTSWSLRLKQRHTDPTMKMTYRSRQSYALVKRCPVNSSRENEPGKRRTLVRWLRWLPPASSVALRRRRHSHETTPSLGSSRRFH